MANSVRQFTDNAGNTVKLDIEIELAIEKKGDYWFASSPHFKTFGYSKVSENEAIEDFDQAFCLFLDIHRERGTLEKALIAFNWKKRNNEFAPAKFFNLRVPRERATRSHKLAFA